MPTAISTITGIFHFIAVLHNWINQQRKLGRSRTPVNSVPRSLQFAPPPPTVISDPALWRSQSGYSVAETARLGFGPNAQTWRPSVLAQPAQPG
jgi:hypothetical protein